MNVNNGSGATTLADWVTFADKAGVVARTHPMAVEFERMMQVVPEPSGPETPGDVPVETPPPAAVPGESPEEHPDSPPHENPDDVPQEMPDDGHR